MAIVTSLAPVINTAGSWSPQECLAELLKAIEDGSVNPSQLVIIYGEYGKAPLYMIAGPGPASEKVGMVHCFLYQYLQDITA